MNTKVKKELRDYFGFSNIKQTYSILGIKNADDAYKQLDKEYKKQAQLNLKEKSKIKSKK